MSNNLIKVYQKYSGIDGFIKYKHIFRFSEDGAKLVKYEELVLYHLCDCGSSRLAIVHLNPWNEDEKCQGLLTFTEESYWYLSYFFEKYIIDFDIYSDCNPISSRGLMKIVCEIEQLIIALGNNQDTDPLIIASKILGECESIEKRKKVIDFLEAFNWYICTYFYLNNGEAFFTVIGF